MPIDDWMVLLCTRNYFSVIKLCHRIVTTIVLESGFQECYLGRYSGATISLAAIALLLFSAEPVQKKET